MPVIDGTVALKKAVLAALKNDSGVSAISGGRVYDVVPPTATKPYISLGTSQVIPQRAQEYAGAQIALTVDGWAESKSSVVRDKLGGAIIDALDGAELDLSADGQRLVNLEIEQANYLRDPDGLTEHVAVTFLALTEPSV